MRQRESTAQLIARLKQRPCQDCGEVFPVECMDFDHVRGAKKANVSEMLHRPSAEVLAEVEKCELVCANCHRIRTRDRHSEAHLDEAETSDILAAMLAP